MHMRSLLFATTVALILLVPALAHAAPEPCAPAGSEWDELLSQGWLWLYLGAFGFGFLTSLTPCVYPMIPIVVGVFGARDESVTRIKAFALATAYVLGMGVMYSVLGVIFALIGKQFGTILANPWVVFPLVGFYALLAASMFGAFDLNLPASWQARLNQVGGRGYGGAFGMGLVGGLTAAPCTGPFLAGILGFVAATNNVIAGSTLLFTYAIGMGVLFWVIAAFTVSLPKSGRWMEWIKSIGGVALLAVGVHFLRPILPWISELTSTSWVFLAGSVALLALGLALGAIHLSFHSAWPVRIRKAVAITIAIAGITGTVNWILTPDRHLPWHDSEEAAFAQARAEGKGVMLDFAADWCAPCKELELTFASAGVYEDIVDNFVPLKFDVSKGTDEDDERQARWRAMTLPAVIFLDANGNEVGRVSEYQPPERFKQTLLPAAERARGGLEPCPAPTATSSRPAATGSAAPAMAARAANAVALEAAAPVRPVMTSVAPRAAVAAQPASHTPGAQAPAPPREAQQPAPQIPWIHSELEGLLAADAANRALLIDFYASWCPPCIRMKKTLAHAEVVSAITDHFVPVRLDVSRMTDEDEDSLRRYGVSKLPTMLFYDPAGDELLRVIDFVEPDELLARLRKHINH